VNEPRLVAYIEICEMVIQPQLCHFRPLAILSHGDSLRPPCGHLECLRCFSRLTVFIVAERIVGSLPRSLGTAVISTCYQSYGLWQLLFIRSFGLRHGARGDLCPGTLWRSQKCADWYTRPLSNSSPLVESVLRHWVGCSITARFVRFDPYPVG
jgi:hypothetical protein